MPLKHEPARVTLDKEPYRFLVYGEFGRRKTTFAGTFPRPLIIDTNGGLLSLALQGVTPMRWEPEGHEDLEDLFLSIRQQVLSGEDEYDTIVIDTVDNLAMQLMGEITDSAVEEKVKMGKKPSLRMAYVPEQGDYYAGQRQMFAFLTKLRKLGKHIVLISSSRSNKDGTVTGPNVSAGMSQVLCDFVSVIGEMIILDEDGVEGETDPEIYVGCGVMLTGESNRRATKSRIPELTPYIVDPTFDKVDAIITKATEAAKAKQTNNNTKGK